MAHGEEDDLLAGVHYQRIDRAAAGFHRYSDAGWHGTWSLPDSIHAYDNVENLLPDYPLSER